MKSADVIDPVTTLLRTQEQYFTVLLFQNYNRKFYPVIVSVGLRSTTWAMEFAVCSRKSDIHVRFYIES